MDQFAGKTAVITGAGSGIGRGMAEYAAAAGMRVVAADVEEPAVAETVALIEEAGAEALGVPTDVTDPAAVDALADAAFDRFGAVHLLHNNAGVFQGGISWQRTLADWDWVMRVNFWGVLHGVKSFVPRLLAQEQSGDADIHIVNTSSLAGVTTTGQSAPYIVSKFAAAALTECLAHDLRATGSSIGVSCLVPGAVATQIARSTRNRPDEPPSEVEAPDHWMVAGFLDQMLNERGRTPLDAAGIVFDGVRARQFWICTAEDERYEELMRSRSDAILEHQLPPTAVY
jgi:NAD(P)-dependent dehydrogenase (short-subunit alcohol dehydrogenase family)